LATLIYADLFDFPLKKEEIWRRLIWRLSRKGGVRPARKNFEKNLKNFNFKDGFYFLPGRQRILGLRREREVESAKKLRIAKQAAKILKIIPLVKFVGLSGSVAAGNPKKGDDIDFFIIARAGWLWTTRFLTTFLFSLLRVRRRPGDKSFRNKICLNMFLDESRLDIFSQNQDLFIAYEICQLKLLWQRDSTYQKFLLANLWIKDFLPNAVKNTLASVPKRNRGTLLERNMVERFFYQFQRWWMKKRRTKEIITPYFIAFHPKGIRFKVLKKFRLRARHYELF